jgi:protein O-GlcNAc transferase
MTLKIDLATAKKQALALHKQGYLTQAEHAYQAILVHHPQELSALHLLGVVYQQQAKFELALTQLKQVLALKPHAPDVLLLAGIISGQLEHHTEALLYFNQVIALQPEDVASHYNRAIACNKLQYYQDALVSLNWVIQQQANHAEALNLRGTVLANTKRYDEALISYQQALAVKADYPVALYHCAIVLEQLKRPQQAISYYQQAIALKPTYSKAISNLASLYMGLQQYSLAAESLIQLMAVEPDYPYAAGRLFYLQTHICDWSNYHASVELLRLGVAQRQALIAPFEFFNVPASPREQLMCAEAYVFKNYPVQSTSLWQGEIYQHTKIKIAYISADFYNHATSILMIELFEQHDRTQFEVIALAFNSKNDEMTERVKKAFDRYIDVSKYSDLQVAELIKSLQIDIAVDLKGHTADARLGIFAYKAAPIQVNYLGQASTIGATYIDYILADRYVVPLQYHADFSEQVVSLPYTYYVNDSKRAISAQVFSRDELGLPEQGFVFCCFNNSYKISPTLFDVWMRLLQQVPNSVLWLLEGNAIARQNLCVEAKKRGIAPERLVFAPKVASSVHLARHQHADLFLDTLPINAHTTACDALWARVPVVTCMGQTFASRVAASLLTAVGLPELITHNLADYEALALMLATSPILLAQIKQKLQYREQSALFDINVQRMAFESAYKTMYQRYQLGLAPQGFSMGVEYV